MTGRPLDSQEVAAIRDHLEPLCQRYLKIARDHDLGRLEEVCLWLLRNLEPGILVGDVLAAAMMLAWHSRDLEVHTITAMACRTLHLVKGPGPIPAISFAMIAELERAGHKGDGMVMELRDRTGQSERNCWARLRAWRDMKASGARYVVELNEDGEMVIVPV
jgi:hypothetical protein